jgi:hypothetical protein
MGSVNHRGDSAGTAPDMTRNGADVIGPVISEVARMTAGTAPTVELGNGPFGPIGYAPPPVSTPFHHNGMDGGHPGG